MGIHQLSTFVERVIKKATHLLTVAVEKVMAARHNIVAVTYVILVFFHLGDCLQCYSCSSAREDYCDDTFSFHAQATVPLTTCENSPVLSIPGAGPNTHCGKTKKKNGDSPNDYVFRGCVPENYCRLVKSHVKECELCETYKCNGSSTLIPYLYMGITCLWITWFKFK